jgi:hypothetical protein
MGRTCRAPDSSVVIGDAIELLILSAKYPLYVKIHAKESSNSFEIGALRKAIHYLDSLCAAPKWQVNCNLLV